jgi:hypothetical protein
MTDGPETLLGTLEDPAIPVNKKLDIATLRTLLQMSSSTLDWSTLERIENLVRQADRETWLRAMLEEIPNLLKTSPAWAVSLLGDEIENNLALLQECLDTMPDTTRQAVQAVIAHEDFTAFYADSGARLK